MKILFVCRRNMFRSRIAEALFRKYNKNENVSAESAGIFEGDYPLNSQDVDKTRKLGINIDGKPRGMSRKLVKSMDLVILVADDVPQELFKDNKADYMTKVITWNISDQVSRADQEVEGIVKNIEKNIITLVKSLENQK